MAGEIVGANAYFQWTYATSKGGAVAGTVTLQGRYRKFDFKRDIGEARITAGADTDESFLTTIKDKEADMTILYQGTAGSALHRALATGNWGSLIWGLEGTATGQPKHGMVAFIKSFSEDPDFEKEVELKVNFKGSGAMLFDFEGSGSVW